MSLISLKCLFSDVIILLYHDVIILINLQLFAKCYQSYRNKIFINVFSIPPNEFYATETAEMIPLFKRSNMYSGIKHNRFLFDFISKYVINMKSKNDDITMELIIKQCVHKGIV